jgi:hypothetical protein
LQIVKVRLDLVEEPPRARTLRRQQAAAVLEAAMGPSRDRAQDVQVGDQGLRRGRLRSYRRVRRVVGDPQHEQRIGQHQLARGVRAGDVGVIEPADLPGR